ncbi:MAG: hypothetical protein ACFB9N_06090 [Geitlerinemataceae cyanobacterium]
MGDVESAIGARAVGLAGDGDGLGGGEVVGRKDDRGRIDSEVGVGGQRDGDIRKGLGGEEKLVGVGGVVLEGDGRAAELDEIETRSIVSLSRS